MKNLFLFLFCLMSLSSIQSQEFTNPENVWIYGYFGTNERYYVQTWGEDAVINGENVKTLTRQMYTVFRDLGTGEVSTVYGPYDGGHINLRLVNSEVYIYNMNRDVFEFVFDFAAEVGDTWDLKTYYDYDCDEMDLFHIEFTNIVDEIELIEGGQNPIEVLHMKTVHDNGTNSGAWYNSRIYKNIGPSTYYTICVEPLDIIDVYPEYEEACYTDYCFSTIAGLSYFADENGSYFDYMEPEILNEMLAIHNHVVSLLDFELAPNPVKEILHIRTDTNVSHISIYNAQGKLVIDQHIDSKAINVKSLPQGLYYVTIQSEDGTEGTGKFFKK